MLHIRAKAALAHHNRFTILGVHAQIADGSQLFGQRIHSAVEADGQNIIVLVQRTIHRAHFYKRAKAPKPGLNGLTRFWVNTNKAWQGE